MSRILARARAPARRRGLTRRAAPELRTLSPRREPCRVCGPQVSGSRRGDRTEELERAGLRGLLVREAERHTVEEPAALGSRGGLGEQVALREPAAELAQLLELLPALDSLGDDPDVEVSGDCDDRTDDRKVAHVGHEVADEAAVDLEKIDVPLLEVAQARVSRAEVVDRDAHPEIAQLRDGIPAQPAAAGLPPLEHRALRELELQHGRAHVVVAGERADLLGQIRPLQLHGGDVHGDGYGDGTLTAPAAHVLEHAIENEIADRND